MAEEIITNPEETESIEPTIDAQEEVVDVNPTPPTNIKGVENFKKLHGILAADEVYSQIVPSDFKQFLSKYSDVTKLQKLHGILAADEVYGQIMPADINVAADKYGFGGLGKPSAVPSPSVSGGSATKERGVLPVSMYSSTVDGYASPKELERTEREKAVLPSEQTIAVKREEVKQKANMPSAKVIEETTPEMLAEGQQRIIKREAERALFENKAKQGNFLGMLQNSLVESYTSTVNNTADMAMYLFSLTGIGMPPEYNTATNEEKAKMLSETLDDMGIKKTLDKQLKTESTTPEYTQKQIEEGGPLIEGVVGLAGSAFPMLTPYQSGFFINGFVDAKKEIQEVMPELSPWKQAAYAFTQGTVQMALERAGFSNLVQNKSVTRALSGKVMDAMRTTFGKFTAKEADNVAAKIINGFAAEYETGATQYVVSEGLKQLTDALEGEDDKFEFEGTEQFFLNMNKAGMSEGVGGGIMKTFSLLPSLIKSPLKKKEAAAVNAQTEQLAADIQNPNVSPEAKVAIDKQINDNAEDVAKAYAEDLNKYEALTEESRADLNRINEDIISHEAVLNDPNVSSETKAISEQRIQELEEQGEGILDSAPVTERKAPIEAQPTTEAAQQTEEDEDQEEIRLQNETGVANRAYSAAIQSEYNIPMKGEISVKDASKLKIYKDNKAEIERTLKVYGYKLSEIETISFYAGYSSGRPYVQINFNLQTPNNRFSTTSFSTQLDLKPNENIIKLGEETERTREEYYSYNDKRRQAAEVPQTLPEVTNEIANLREQEQAENEAIDPNDEVAKKEIYDRYDKAITPLLEQEKELKAEEAQAPVAEEAKGESGAEGDGFKQAGEKARDTKDATHIGRWMLDNSQKGDVVRFQDGGYEVTEVTTKKDGTKELVLTPFEFNEDGSKDYNNTGVKIITEQSIKNGSNLFENAYTNSKGERVIEQSTYEPVAQSLKQSPTSEQAPQAFPAQEGAESVEDKFQANSELEQIYRELQEAVNKNIDEQTLRILKANPSEAMIKKAFDILQSKGVIKIDCN